MLKEYLKDHQHDHHTDQNNQKADHHDPQKNHHDDHEQHGHFEHHEVLKEYLKDQHGHHTDQFKQKTDPREQNTNQHEHHSDHGQHDLLDNPISHYLHHDDHHHEDDLSPMQRKIREMTASKDSKEGKFQMCVNKCKD